MLEHRISSMTMHRYQSVLDAYINPTIIEERTRNVAAMDVFSRLMMDRIIFLGVPIDDDVANIIQAQLLFLDDCRIDVSVHYRLIPVHGHRADSMLQNRIFIKFRIHII